MSEAFVIVGAGQAGAWVARTLRAEGFAGSVLLIGDEAYPPYERPPLSKAVLRGEMTIDETLLLTQGQAADENIGLWLGERVLAIDRGERRLRCASGRRPGYSRLFLTTGSRPRPAAMTGDLNSSRIHMLRNHDDAARLRAALSDCRHLGVIGGGWIGLEVAATARELGCDVTVIEAGPRLCARSAPEPVSDWLATLHRAHGVDLRLGVQVRSVSTTPDQLTIILDDQPPVLCDQLVIGIGVVPNTELAEAAGLDVANGVVVDAAGRTSDPDIFAAGDVASQPCAFTGRHLRREAWANAQNQAIIAARAALGQDVTYTEPLWLWSDQYGLNIQIIGMPEQGVEPVKRHTPEAGSGSWLMLDGAGQPVGSISVNSPADLRLVRKALEQGARIDLDQWRDPMVPARRIMTVGGQ